VGCGGSPEDAFPSVLEDAVVDEVELHASSMAVDDERHVIRLHDLVVPAFFFGTSRALGISANGNRVACHGNRA
jgi:hypothetical protein